MSSWPIPSLRAEGNLEQSIIRVPQVMPPPASRCILTPISALWLDTQTVFFHSRPPEARLLSGNLLADRGSARLTVEEHRLLDEAITEVVDVPARSTLFRAGDQIDVSAFVVEGFMARFIADRTGLRQLVAVEVPGDFIDLHAFPLTVLDHDVGTITASRIAIVPHADLDRLIVEHPDLGRKLWFSTLLDAAQHRQWIFRIGRLSALARVSHFLCEMFVRLNAIGRTDGTTFHLPMTQADIGDVCGLTSIHVNRVIRQLRDQNLYSVSEKDVSLPDFEGLAKAGNFSERYLYLRHPFSAVHSERIAIGAPS